MAFRSFLEYYENEMNYLIDSGKDLKKLYPSLSTLDFSNESNDPDVKKLIEGTAFLNANLQKRIDEKNIELSQEILNSIYPYFNRPTPSISVFQIQSPHNVFVLPKYSNITSKYTYDNQYFTFLTTHSIKTSSFQIDDIKKIHSSSLPRYISKDTNTAIEISLSKIFDSPEKEMIFYINKMENASTLLYEALFTFYKDRNTPVFEDNDLIGEIEFFDDFSILPSLKNDNTSYNPAIEFNLFKEKFFFFKVKFFKEPKKHIHLPIKDNKNLNLSPNSFLLNCVIGVNLFEKTSDPIQITHQKHRYKLIFKPNTDLYAIYNVQNASDPDQKFINYFSLDFGSKQTNDVLWYYKKDNNITSSTFLYFIDETFAQKTIFAKYLCLQTNANELLSNNEEWKISNYNLKCINLKKPTKYHSNANHQDSQRTLISLLNLNYFGLDNNETLKYLKSIFDIYSNYNSSYHYLNYIHDIKFDTKMIPVNGAMTPKIFVTMRVSSDPKAFFLSRIISKLIFSIIAMNKKLNITLIKNETEEIWKEWNIL